ncbi:MAG TPA: hypothetical protein VFB72_13345 [Verrucomicrobiae bacterium]|nr:hypothetical protein [Verrucomicrobiae bacterium]
MNEGELKNEMVLAYDSKREIAQREVSKGQITRVYFLPYEGEHMFEIDEGERRSSWPRPKDNPWFIVGYFAEVEHTKGKNPDVLRIWIGTQAK